MTANNIQSALITTINMFKARCELHNITIILFRIKENNIQMLCTLKDFKVSSSINNNIENYDKFVIINAPLLVKCKHVIEVQDFLNSILNKTEVDATDNTLSSIIGIIVSFAARGLTEVFINVFKDRNLFSKDETFDKFQGDGYFSIEDDSLQIYSMLELLHKMNEKSLIEKFQKNSFNNGINLN